MKGSVTYIRLPPDLKAKLQARADRENRPLVNMIVTVLIKAMEKADG